MALIRLGEILVRKGYLAVDALNEALAAQAAMPAEGRLPVGQILLEKGLITEDQLLEALEIQRRLAERAANPSA